MKKMLVLVSLVVAQSSFAGILNSSLDKRHANVVEASIINECGYFKNLTEITTSKEVIIVDQGVRDAKFVTKLEGEKRLDQNIFDHYEITVESEYTDMYDHSTNNWGVFSVNSVTCSMN